jgi:protein-S-isoprenylcysteine O-methyltransferase Ste14
MTIFFDVFFIALLFFLFGFIHTYLGTLKFKRKVAEKIGDYIAFYRLAYNIFALLSFYLIYILSPKPDIIIYDLNYPWDILNFVFQALSLIGFVWAGLPTDLPEFLGISQIRRWLKGNYREKDIDETSVLKTNGPYKLCRHPIYLFSILFLGFRSTMSLFYFVFFICIIVYFYVGSYYEEKRLLEKFGEEYLNYKKITPRIIPNIF